jgi:CDP-glucose 4,6-dehydratase
VSLPAETNPNLFSEANVGDFVRKSVFLDIRDAAELASVVRQENPEVVIHLAAQPLVRLSYSQPIETFATNVMGTVHLMESIRGVASVRVAVMVTSDKVYANREWGLPFREEDTLGGHDPYSASKAASEIVIDSYRQAFLGAQGVMVASARAGNVIGGGDWSIDRLIPDAVRAWETRTALSIRRPDAVRPWQHVLEPLAGYLVLAQRLWTGEAAPGAYNFGPHSHEAVSVREVASLATEVWGDGAQVTHDEQGTGPHEARLLTLETARARCQLDLLPRWDARTAIRRTLEWYQAHRRGQRASDLCNMDISAYEAEA